MAHVYVVYKISCIVYLHFKVDIQCYYNNTRRVSMQWVCFLVSLRKLVRCEDSGDGADSAARRGQYRAILSRSAASVTVTVSPSRVTRVSRLRGLVTPWCGHNTAALTCGAAAQCRLTRPWVTDIYTVHSGILDIYLDTKYCYCIVIHKLDTVTIDIYIIH